MQHPDAPSVQADHLTIQTAGDDPQLVLEDVSFRVEPGQALLVEGPSGCGKSTLLHLIAGNASFLDGWSYGGRLLVGGPEQTEADTALPSSRARTAYVPQEAGEGLLHLDVLSALRHAATASADRGRPLRHRLIRASQRYGIVDLLDRDVSTLSVGERKRVAFAAVELRDPDLILLDEPLAGLDPHATRLVLEDIQRLHDRRRTIIISEHRGHLLEHLVDQRLVLTDPQARSQKDSAVGRRDPYPLVRRRAPSTAALVRVEGLSIDLPERNLLRDGHLDLGPGLWYLVGPNGAGKTTLLSVLAGLAAPTAGTATLAGTQVWPLAKVRGRSPRRRRYGRARRGSDERKIRAACRIAFQEPRESFLSTSVIQELRAPQEAIHQRAAEEAEHAALALMEACGIEHLVERSPLHLSGGEARRVQLLDGLLTQPQVWLIDEPTPGLDDRSLQVMRDLLQRFVAMGGCAIVATHEPHLMPAPQGYLILDGSGTLQVTADAAAVVALGYDVPEPTARSPPVVVREAER